MASKTTASGMTKELKTMMYGFGDVIHPRDDTVQTVEQCLLTYLDSLLHHTLSTSRHRHGRLKASDLLHVLANDDKKMSRVEVLLHMHEELKQARRAFDITAELEGAAALVGEDSTAVASESNAIITTGSASGSTSTNDRKKEKSKKRESSATTPSNMAPELQDVEDAELEPSAQAADMPSLF